MKNGLQWDKLKEIVDSYTWWRECKRVQYWFYNTPRAYGPDKSPAVGEVSKTITGAWHELKLLLDQACDEYGVKK